MSQDTFWSHLKDVVLHALGAAVMMFPCFLASTPTIVALPWGIAVAMFWLGRELAQAKDPINQWRLWKWLEGLVPASISIGCGIGITIWRLV